MQNQSLVDEITKLIETKREDEWWDFKQKHHADNVSLVHDILCMANNRARRDSYIIFGIEDASFSIVGVENDENRKNQQKITNILSNISFAGNVRPRIEMYTIDIGNHEIDVLVIKDSTYVPYYLTKDYHAKSNKTKDRFIRKYHIYTRVVDTNTAIDEQADLNDIEFLWRKRFGIDLSIMERLNILLDETRKWNFDWGNKNYCYHIDYPEFQVLCDEEKENVYIPPATFYTNPKMNYCKLKIVYHNTILHETELWIFDSFRKYLPLAKTGSIHATSKMRYYYYLLDSIEGKLLRIFTYGSCEISSRCDNNNQLLIFRNDEERELFEQYVIEHFHDISDDEVISKYGHEIEQVKYNIDGKSGYDAAFHVAKCGMFYEKWKKNN